MTWNKNVNLKNILFTLLVIFAVWFIAQINQIALLAFASFVLACALNPAVDQISENRFISRSFASFLVILITILIIVLFLIPVISISIHETEQLIMNTPDYWNKIIAFLSSKSIMGKPLIEYINLETITTASSQFASGIVDKSINFTKTIMETLTISVTLGIIVFYMLYEKNLIKDAVIVMFPVIVSSSVNSVSPIVHFSNW